MKSRWLKMVRRFWPGLVALAVVLVVLFWIMQPRPREKVDLVVPPEQPRHARGEAYYSKDKRYLAVHYYFRDESEAGFGYQLALYDTVAVQELFRISGEIRQITFEPSGTLLFRVRPANGRRPEPIDEQLLRWNPATKSQQVVCSYHLPASKFEALKLRSSFTPQKPYPFYHWSLLSPDGRTWIVPCFDERTYWYERIDVASGKSQGRLALPEMLSGNSSADVCGMRFSDDSEILMVQTRSGLGSNARYRLHWLQTSTGQELGSMFIPNDIAGISYVSSELVVAEAHQPRDEKKKEHEVYVIRWREQALKRIVLDEIQPDRQERPEYIESKYVVPGVRVECRVDPVSQTLVSSWSYFYSEQQRWFVNHVSSRNVHDFHYSVRDLTTGKLVHEDCLKAPLREDGLDAYVGGGFLQAVLPGPLLFVSRSDDLPENLFLAWMYWLQYKLNIEQEVFKQTHYVIDGMSGKTLSEMGTPGNIQDVKLSDDQATLMLTNFRQESYLYDYPVHKPWLLIWSWALGVAVVVTLVGEGQRLRRGRKV